MVVGDKLIELMGYSVEHPNLKQIFKDLKLVTSIDFGTGDFLERSYKSQLTPEDTFDIVVKSMNRKNFVRTYGEPQFALDSKGNEQILFEFSLDHQENKDLMQNIALPFGLQYGDDSDTIIKKIGQKPSEKFNDSNFYTDDRHKEKNGYWFNLEDYRVLTALNADFKLVWIRCTLLELQVKKLRDLKKRLKQENKNIKSENKELILASLNKLPSTQWRLRMAEGDNMFTEKAIEDIENELKIFIEKLAVATEKKNATTIHNTIKKLVVAINKLNIVHKRVVETLEREELCSFIVDVAKATGFFAESNIDFTEEWRQW